MREHAEKKGFKGVADVLRTSQSLHQMLGAQDKSGIFRLPQASRTEDPDGWAEVDRALGVPETAAGYDWAPPEGAPEVNAEQLNAWYERFHAAGVSKSAAGALLTQWAKDAMENGGGDAAAAAADAAFQKEIDEGTAALKREWGQTFEANGQAAEAALAQVDTSGELVSLIKDAQLDKHPAVLRFGHELSKLFSDAGITPNNQSAPALTRDQAAKAISEFENNDTKMKAWSRGDAAAVKEYQDLHIAASRAR